MKNRQSSCTKFRNSGYHLLLLLSTFSLIVSLLNGCSFRRVYVSDKTDEEIFYSINPVKYMVSPIMPAEKQVFNKDDSPPVFIWSVQVEYPDIFILEINYLDDKSSCMEQTAEKTTAFFLSESDWDTIKDYAPITANGFQKIYWRVRIDYAKNMEDGSYYSDWTYFLIQS